jgi:hypothetical protein
MLKSDVVLPNYVLSRRPCMTSCMRAISSPVAFTVLWKQIHEFTQGLSPEKKVSQRVKTSSGAAFEPPARFPLRVAWLRLPSCLRQPVQSGRLCRYPTGARLDRVQGRHACQVRSTKVGARWPSGRRGRDASLRWADVVPRCGLPTGSWPRFRLWCGDWFACRCWCLPCRIRHCAGIGRISFSCQVCLNKKTVHIRRRF